MKKDVLVLFRIVTPTFGEERPSAILLVHMSVYFYTCTRNFVPYLSQLMRLWYSQEPSLFAHIKYGSMDKGSDQTSDI